MSAGSPTPPPQFTIGIEGRYEADVRPELTLKQYDPRLPAVFSTPAMIGMMEAATSRAVAPSLPENSLTVGTRVVVDHLKAIPGGSHVVATARLTEQHGRFLVFDVEARCGDVLIGRGQITRAVVDRGRFLTIAAGERPIPRA